MLQDRSKRRIAILGSRHVPVVSIHLIELVARSLAQEGHNLVTSGSQGVNAAVIRSVLEIDPARLTVLLPRALIASQENRAINWSECCIWSRSPSTMSCPCRWQAASATKTSLAAATN